jgi:hypothetical protein
MAFFKLLLQCSGKRKTRASNCIDEQLEVRAVTITTLSLRLRNVSGIKMGFAEEYCEDAN